MASPIDLAAVLWLGLAAGGLHATTGPDHLAGVAPFAARSAARAWRTGVAWGLGHATGAGAAAFIALGLRTNVPGLEEHLSAWSERIVGVLLCLIGALGLRAYVRLRSAAAHDHLGARTQRPVFVLGLFHGAAGLSHVFGVLPALGLPGTLLPALYLAGYGLGSLALITLFALGVGRLASSARPAHGRRAVLAASVLSLAVGAVWLVHPL